MVKEVHTNLYIALQEEIELYRNKVFTGNCSKMCYVEMFCRTHLWTLSSAVMVKLTLLCGAEN